MKYAFQVFTAIRVVFARVAFAEDHLSGAVPPVDYLSKGRLEIPAGDGPVPGQPRLFFLCRNLRHDLHHGIAETRRHCSLLPPLPPTASAVVPRRKAHQEDHYRHAFAVAGVAGASSPPARLGRPNPVSVTC